MDRATVYYGQLPRDVDILRAGQYAMVGVAKMAEATLGTPTAVDGFTCTPTTPASLNVILTPGTVYQLANLEGTLWSALAADTAHSIVKQGIQLDPVTLGITPPTTTGYSQVYLVQVAYADNDTGATVLPYYNSSNPQVSFSGPANSGIAQNTIRQGAVAVEIKAGIAATSGTQVAPSPDPGYVGLFTVTVANGDTSVAAGNITQLTTAPFIPVKLPDIPWAIQSGKWIYALDTGTADAMVAQILPVPRQLVPGMAVRIKKGANANTGAVTLDIGLGANTVVRANGAALQAGDLPANTVAEVIWDGAYWQVMNFQGFNATTTNNNTYNIDIPYAVDSGTVNALVASYTPAITSLTAGLMIEVKVANTNTGAATIAVNALSAVAIKRRDGSALQGNDLYAGMVALLAYDGTNFQLMNAAAAAAAGGGGSTPPTGTIHMWPLDTPPSWGLACNGQAVAKATYSALYAVIGGTYGETSTTFNLPPMSGRAVRGVDHGAGVDPDAATRANRGDGTGGDHVGTLQADAAGPVNISGAAVEIDGITIHESQYPSGDGFLGLQTDPTLSGYGSDTNPKTAIVPGGLDAPGNLDKLKGTMSVSANVRSTETRMKNINMLFVIAT